MGKGGSLEHDGIYALAQTSATQPPDLINNQFLTGIPSTDPTNTSAFHLYAHLPGCSPQDILEILQR